MVRAAVGGLERMCGHMEEWSVSVEGRRRGVEESWFGEGDVEVLGEALEGHYPAVAGGRSLEARISVEARDAEEAVSRALGLYLEAANEALGGEEIETVAVEVMTAERLEEELFGPDEREVLLGVAEAAELLGVSKTRVGALREQDRFPRPAQELASGPVWRLIDLKGFEKEWDRRPGPKAAGKTLGEARREAGESVGSLAGDVNLPKDVLIKLERGKIALEGVPAKLLERLGSALGRSPGQVFALAAGPAGARTVLYKAEGTPGEAPSGGAPLEPFEEALRRSPYFDEGHREDWLPEGASPGEDGEG